MNNILTGIYNTFAGSQLSTDIGGRIYLDQAPSGTPFPYLVYQVVSVVPQDTFKDNIEDALVQFSIFSSSTGLTEITTLYNDLNTLFDDTVLTITSNTSIWCVRQNLVTQMEPITTDTGEFNIRHWAIDYSILVQKTA